MSPISLIRSTYNYIYIYTRTSKIKETVIIEQKNWLKLLSRNSRRTINTDDTLKTEIDIEAFENITKAIQITIEVLLVTDFGWKGGGLFWSLNW